MIAELRKTGISVVGDIPWGTHFCHFFETKEDLVDILIPYFKTGLETNECCLWVVSDPLDAEDAKDALRRAVPEADHYLEAGRIEIAQPTEWYLKDGTFVPEQVINRWIEKLAEALSAGCDGLRVNGIEAWLTKEAWNDFAQYEKTLDDLLATHRMIVLCSYPLVNASAAQILDVVQTHQFALIRRQGEWEIVESSELKQAKAEIKRLNEELEQRVIERTQELVALNDMLRREITGRWQIMEALRNSEERFAKTFHSSPTPQVIVRLSDGSFLDVNDTFSQLFGYGRAEVIGQTALSLDLWVNPQERQGLMQMLREERVVRNYETRARTKSGSLLDMLVFMELMELSGEQYVLVTGYDITERKRMEEVLRQSESNFLTLAEKSLQGIAIFQDQKMIYANPALSTIQGYTIKELKSMSAEQILSLTHPLDRAIAAERARKRMAGEEISPSIELRVLRKDGSTIWIRAFNSAIEYQGRPAILNTSIDITERKQAEEESRWHAARMDVLVEISNAFAEAGLDYPAVLKAIARRTAEVIGDSCVITLFSDNGQRAFPVAYYHTDPKALELMHAALLHSWQSGMDTERFRTLLAGESIYIAAVDHEEYRAASEPEFWPYIDAIGISSVLIVPLRVQGGVIGTLGITRDRSGSPYTPQDRTLLQDLADRAGLTIANAKLFDQVRSGHERLQALSRRLLEVQEAERRLIARELHDEIGQTLTHLKLLLDTNTRLPMETAKNRLGEAQSLLNQLMDQVEELSLNLHPPMLDELGLLPTLLAHFERYTRQTNVQVTFKQNGLKGRHFRSDLETAVYRLIQEALTNVARHAGVGEVIVRVWVGQEMLGVEIEDHGVGFDLLETGASMGLAGMRERVALVGGQLTIESAPGNGTQITAELPLESSPERIGVYDYHPAGG